MYVYVRANFQVSSIILTSFNAKRTPRKPTLIRVNDHCSLLGFYIVRTLVVNGLNNSNATINIGEERNHNFLS